MIDFQFFVFILFFLVFLFKDDTFCLFCFMQSDGLLQDAAQKLCTKFTKICIDTNKYSNNLEKKKS